MPIAPYEVGSNRLIENKQYIITDFCKYIDIALRFWCVPGKRTYELLCDKRRTTLLQELPWLLEELKTLYVARRWDDIRFEGGKLVLEQSFLK